VIRSRGPPRGGGHLFSLYLWVERISVRVESQFTGCNTKGSEGSIDSQMLTPLSFAGWSCGFRAAGLSFGAPLRSDSVGLTGVL